MWGRKRRERAKQTDARLQGATTPKGGVAGENVERAPQLRLAAAHTQAEAAGPSVETQTSNKTSPEPQPPAPTTGRDLIVAPPQVESAPRRRITDRGRRPILIGLTVALLFFGGLGVWSAVAPIESAASAIAVVKVESNRLTVDHPDGGTIAALLVREGDAVEEGQLLITLDTTEIEAQLSVLELRRFGLLSLRARLNATQAGRTASPILTKFWNARRQILRSPISLQRKTACSKRPRRRSRAK